MIRVYSQVNTPQEQRRPNLPAVFILTIIVLAAYADILTGDFSFDDTFVLHRARILNPSECNWRCWFPPIYYRTSGERSYRPAVTFSYYLQATVERLFNHGRPAFHPSFFKAGNLLLHLAAVLLLWRLARRLLNRQAALFAAALFACHPATTEAVNAIGFREDLLVAVFGTAGVLAAIAWTQRPSPVRRAAALLSFAAAFLSKESAYVYPLMLAAVLAALHTAGRPTRRAAAAVTAAGALALVSAVLFLVFLRNRVTVPYAWLEGYSGPRWALCGPLMAAHLRILFLPYPLIADRYFSAAEAGAPPLLAIETLGLLFLIAILLGASWRADHRLFAAFAWIILPLLPVSGLIPLSQPLADRFYYVPCMGVGLLAGWCWERLLAAPRVSLHPMRARVVVGMGISLLLLCIGLTAHRNIAWSCEGELWSRTLRSNPSSARACANIGRILMRQGRPLNALQFLKEARRLEPGERRHWENLAACLAACGRTAEALHLSQETLERFGPSTTLLMNMARMYLDLPDPDPQSARKSYRRARALGAGRDHLLEERLARNTTKTK